MREKREEDVLEIDLLELAGLLLHKLWLLALCMVLAGGLGFLLSAFVFTPQYESETGVYILSSSAESSTLSYSDTQLASQLTKDYEELITCRSVLEAVNVVDTANLPEEPSEPSVLLWTAIAAAAGLILCAAAVIVRDIMDDTLKSAEDVENYLGLSTLALIPVLQGESSSRKKKKKAGEK